MKQDGDVQFHALGVNGIELLVVRMKPELPWPHVDAPEPVFLHVALQVAQRVHAAKRVAPGRSDEAIRIILDVFVQDVGGKFRARDRRHVGSLDHGLVHPLLVQKGDELLRLHVAVFFRIAKNPVPIMFGVIR